ARRLADLREQRSVCGERLTHLAQRAGNMTGERRSLTRPDASGAVVQSHLEHLTLRDRARRGGQRLPQGECSGDDLELHGVRARSEPGYRWMRAQVATPATAGARVAPVEPSAQQQARRQQD